MLSGCTTALVTPFRGGRLDTEGLRENVRFQVKGHVAALLVAGSTGESPNLTDEEYEQAFVTVRAEVKGRTKLVAGCGTNNTAKSAWQVARAERLGADAALVVAPYYNKPTQEGLYRHFRTVAEATRLPIIVYNIPPRSVVNILPVTLDRLAQDCPNIVAVKEAAGSLDQVTDIVSRCGDRVTVLSGDDSLTLPMLAVGAKGVISVVSNLVPGDVVAMINDFMSGRTRPAAKRHLRLFPLIKAMFIETNPTPVKAAMDLLGMAAGDPRLPLVPPTGASLKAIRRALTDYGLKPKRA